jgi:hypothetical protein
VALEEPQGLVNQRGEGVSHLTGEVGVCGQLRQDLVQEGDDDRVGGLQSCCVLGVGESLDLRECGVIQVSGDVGGFLRAQGRGEERGEAEQTRRCEVPLRCRCDGAGTEPVSG